MRLSVYSLAAAVTAAGAVLTRSQCASNRTVGPIVSLDYATFEGHHDDIYGLDVWKGCVTFFYSNETLPCYLV